MMGGHTPGPWVWRGKDGGLYQEGTTHRFGDAVLVPSYEYDSGIDTVVSEADMALIAAAPDLLSALKDAMRSSRKDFKAGPDGDRQHQEAYAEQFAAISKAEGKP